MGLYGLSIATDCTRFTTLIMFLIYFNCKICSNKPEVRMVFKQIWMPLSKDVLYNLTAFT